jgi:sulfur-oxidizing protein SoxA
MNDRSAEPAGPPPHRLRAASAALALAAVLAVITEAGAADLTSARELLSPELRAMQADDGANPGMLWVEQGAKLWERPEGAAGKACTACHGDATVSMKGVAARYPAIEPQSGRLLNLELRINTCRSSHMQATPLAYESNELLALTAFVAHQSRGLPLSVATGGPAAPYYEAGRQLYFERQGQLNLACSQCHDELVGRRLRGDRISSGLATAFPAYRIEWQSLGSLHRRLRACSLGVRAHQYELGAPEYLALELYLAARSAGAPIETPGVRR